MDRSIDPECRDWLYSFGVVSVTYRDSRTYHPMRFPGPCSERDSLPWGVVV